MIILPAIDIKDGNCVRLFKGDFSTVEKVAADYMETAKGFEKAGASWIHMVDLDGAKEGKPVNTKIYKDVATKTSLKVEVGGGIRNLETIEEYLAMGISRVIIGSAALKNPQLVKDAVNKFGCEKIAVGIDSKNGMVATEGWLESSDVHYIDLAKKMIEIGVKYFIVTDISKDGTLSGVNTIQLAELSKATKGQCNIIASGGVHTIEDIKDPVLYAEEYNKQGADEIVFYDITASFEGRGVFLDVVRETAKKVFVPLTVGGGIKTVDDIREALRAGADKVSVNSQAVQNPQLIKDGADIFGSQCICVGIDAKRISDKKWTVFINGGRVDMKLDLIDWVKQIEQLGAGEICLNSIDADGTKAGFDIPMLDAVCSAVNIPVIASGGAGKIDDFSEVFEKTGATAALAASLFHFKELTVGEVKDYCRSKGIIVR